MSEDGSCIAAARSRVLLVYPPSRTQAHYSCPVGLLMLGAVLERAGHEVHVLDANAVERRWSSEEIAAEAERLRPDVIGVTLLTPLAREAYRLAGLLRGSGARLLAGGPHATLVPEEPLAFGFDAVAVGEGEPVVDAAVRALLGERPMDSVPGLLWRAGDEVRRTPPAPPPQDLDALPFPARHLARAADYQPLAVEATVFSSRGCTARCAYCAGGLFGKRFRFRSAGNVLAEVLALHREHGTRHVHFCDDAMSLDRPRLRAICQGLIEAGRPVAWSMMTRIDGVDEELLRLAAEAGCVRIDYGVESGSPATLRAIHKPHTLEMVRRIIPLTKAAGITPCVFFILGFPWEDVAALEETRALMEALAPYVGDFHPAVGSVLVPFPGTELYEKYREARGLDRWWLGSERNFDVPRPGTHAYYEYVVFRNGAILDADFFGYRPEIRSKIVEIFRFMYFQNLRSRGLASRTTQRLVFDASLALSRRWPRLERWVFARLGRAVVEARTMQQVRARRAAAAAAAGAVRGAAGAA
jgi:anaerobic magnesium-protoporphyrin IX monomethyl ester cyclase